MGVNACDRFNGNGEHRRKWYAAHDDDSLDTAAAVARTDRGSEPDSPD